MSEITLKSITDRDFLVYENDKVVGDVMCRRDILDPGTMNYFVHITEDPRGAHLVPEGGTVKATVQLALDTHPLFS